jgi:alpha-L-fucosidase 2
MKTTNLLTHSCQVIIVFTSITLGSPAFSQDKTLTDKPPVSILSFIPEGEQIKPMPIDERVKRGIVPQRGVCSISPGSGLNDLLMSGNGKMYIKVYGNPLSEQIVFQHERLLVPWKMPFEAPKIANILPDVRDLILNGKYHEALKLSLESAAKAGTPTGLGDHRLVPAFKMLIDQSKTDHIRNYLRTVDFESGEIKVFWEDKNGRWERQAFVSRPDNVVVQLLSAPTGQTLNTRITLQTSMNENIPIRMEIGKYRTETVTYNRDFNEQRLIVEGHFNPETGNFGYAGVVRVILNGGKARIDSGVLVVEGAKSLLLVTRIEWYKDFQKSKVQALVNDLDIITPDYQNLLARNREVQSKIIDRASLDFETTPEENAMSGEELLADQKTRIGYNLNLLSKLFDMGRYWLMLESGDYPPIHGNVNININFQVSGGAMSNLPEAMNAFYNWVEGLLPDSRTNARNIFGARGALFSAVPDQQEGVLYRLNYAWPHHYWVSAGGWLYSPFWDHYLVTGDKEFLRNRIMPGLKEIALFYEDYLKMTDEKGNYIFIPSYSPENWPSNSNSSPSVINATMDIMVCHEVLTHLIEGAEILGTEAENIPRWKDMLTKMPNYLLDEEGALKEWTWPTLTERLDHRHVSHFYGVWPADEIDPDNTPQLAKAVWLANRKRAQEESSGFGLAHRAIAGARLKDNFRVNFELKQLLEQGYFGPVLTSSHNPYTGFMPDEQGSVLTLLMEMLVYSREGVVELLPALPESLDQGSIKGILSRSFAKIENLTWDMKTKTIEMTINSLRTQDITLIVRYGIESITAPAGVLTSQPKADATTCVIHLPQNKPVTIQVKLGQHKPSDWILKMALKS